MSFVKSFFGRVLIEATEAHVRARWEGKPPGQAFRCGLCGHRFEVGDRWRGVMANIADSPVRRGNFLICGACHEAAGGEDGPLLERRAALEREMDRLAALGISPPPEPLTGRGR